MLKSISPGLQPVLLLAASNVCMTIAGISLAQLKITLAVFVPFAIFFIDQPLQLDLLGAGLCLFGAGCFVSRT